MSLTKGKIYRTYKKHAQEGARLSDYVRNNC